MFDAEIYRDKTEVEAWKQRCPILTLTQRLVAQGLLNDTSYRILRTVAIYSHEDRFSLHRFKADEAFLIGPHQGGEPVRPVLDGLHGVIADAARRAGAPGPPSR
jgi:hypothetical protein